MKITAISMVRNEADVIEAFVRHHAGIVDQIIVVDHRSVDSTADVLRALAAEGLPLTVRREQSLVHRQNLVLTALMREAAIDHGADWVVPLDADEFLVAPGGEARAVLETLSPDRPCTVDLHFYVPRPDDPGDEPHVLRRIRHRQVGESQTWTRKVIVPAVHARDAELSLAQGSHGLLDTRNGGFAPLAHTDRLVLAHFPVRSASQIARKALGGWPAHVARPDRQPGGAFQWKRAFEAIATGRRVTPRRLHALAVEYAWREGVDGARAGLVFDPVPAPFELRYRPTHEPTPLEVLADTAMTLAEELADALRARR